MSSQARAEPRKMFMCRVSVAWEDQDGGAQRQGGMLEDRSRSGAGISINKPIPVGAKVKIVGKRLDLSGTVRYCRREQFKYFVGIQYDRPEDLG
jgi:hypothetical protein